MAKRNPFLIVFIALSICVSAAFVEIVTASEDPEVLRTRQQIEMLDDLYKTAIVLITDHYVTDPSKFSMPMQGWPT